MHFKTQMTKTKFFFKCFRISYQKREMNKNELDEKRKMKMKNKRKMKKSIAYTWYVKGTKNDGSICFLAANM